MPQEGINWKGIAQATGFVLAAGAGASAMYFFDPSRGRARRAVCRDKAASMYKKSLRMFHNKVEDLENRIRGMELEMKHGLEEEGPIDDEKLAARIKTKLGRVTEHAHPIEAHVKAGHVELRGRVVVDEVDKILSEVRRMTGVKGVVNHMAMFEDRSALR